MSAYANALLYAIPGFMLLIIVELMVDAYQGKRRFRGFDTISSLSSGITNVIKSLLQLIIVLAPYPLMVEYLALFEVEAGFWAFALGFVAKDFAGYWNHRLAHKVNYFWNRHIVHHSSEEFNLACALRQSISEIFGFYALFLIPAALIGIPHEVMAILAPIHLFLQFWYHTQYIGKLGWLEYILVTPSQHRVHHAINPIYLDKNLGQIFTWWDRMFGTFQEELPEEPCVYGVTRPVSTWNPIKINFLHLWLLACDAWRTKSWRDKLRIWIMPTGWRPADVAERYPVGKIEDIYHFKKYSTHPSRGLLGWVWYQFAATLALALLMLFQISESLLSYPQMLLYGAMIFVGVYGFSSLMDRERIAPWLELSRGAMGVAIVIVSGDWFGLSEYWAAGQWAIVAYYLSTALGGVYVGLKEAKSPVRKLITA